MAKLWDDTQTYNLSGRSAGLASGSGDNWLMKKARSAENAIGTTFALPAALVHNAETNAHTAKVNREQADERDALFQKYGFASRDDYYKQLENSWDADGNATAETERLLNIPGLDEEEKALNSKHMGELNDRANELRDYAENNYVSKKVGQDRGKFLGSAINTLSTGFDVLSLAAGIPNGALTNAGQGAIEGVADELEQSGFQNFDWGRAGQNAAVGAAAGAATGALNTGISNRMLANGGNIINGRNIATRGLNSALKTGVGRGALSGAVGGAVGGATGSALSGQDIGTGVQNTLAGAGRGALQGAVVGGTMSAANRAFNRFAPNAAQAMQENAARNASYGDTMREQFKGAWNSGDSGTAEFLKTVPGRTDTFVDSVDNSQMRNIGSTLQEVDSPMVNRINNAMDEAARVKDPVIENPQTVRELEQMQKGPQVLSRERQQLAGYQALAQDILEKLGPDADSSSFSSLRSLAERGSYNPTAAASVLANEAVHLSTLDFGGREALIGDIRTGMNQIARNTGTDLSAVLSDVDRWNKTPYSAPAYRDGADASGANKIRELLYDGTSNRYDNSDWGTPESQPRVLGGSVKDVADNTPEGLAKADDWGASYKLDGNTIKQKLKSYGINTDGLKIRRKYGGYSDAWYVDGDSAKTDLGAVERILKDKLEYYQTDERTGEILSGGNTFVFVNDSAPKTKATTILPLEAEVVSQPNTTRKINVAQDETISEIPVRMAKAENPETELYRTVTGETEAPRTTDTDLMYGESELGNRTRRGMLADSLERFGNTLEGAQTNVTRAAAKDLGIESTGKVVENVRKKTGLTNLETQAAFAKELTGDANSLMDRIQKKALTASEDGKGYKVNTDNVSNKVETIVDEEIPLSLFGSQNARNKFIGNLRRDITSYDSDILTKANKFKAVAADLRGKGVVEPAALDKAKSKVYTKIANELDDLSYKAIPQDNVDDMFDATINEMRGRAKQAEANGNKDIAKAYNQAANKLDAEPRTIKAFRSFKKDFVDVSKINELTQRAENGAAVQMGRSFGGSLKRFGNSLLQRPVNATLAKAGGMVNNVADNIANRASATTGAETPAPTPATTVGEGETASTTSTPSTQLYNIIGRETGRDEGEKAASGYIEQAARNMGPVTIGGANTLDGTTSLYNSIYGGSGSTASAANSSVSTPNNYYTNILARAMNLAMDANDAAAFGALYEMYNDAVQSQSSTTDTQTKLTDKQRQANAAERALNDFEQAEHNFAYDVSDIPVIGGIANLGGNEYASKAEALALQIGYMLSGATVNAQEAKNIGMAYVPQPRDNESVRKSKLAQIRGIISDYQQTYAE